MELRHLRYVVALADSLHFGHAAEQLHISQPPLSQQIRQLEDELGVQLFHRTKRLVRLTDAGKLFVEEARLILAQANHAAKVAMRAPSGEAGQITLGVAGPADTPILLEVLRRFARRHPNIRIVLRAMGTAPQAQALREGRLHVGFVAASIDDPALAVETVIRQSLVVALPRTHVLAERSHVPLQALATESLVMFERDLEPDFFDAIVHACREAGVGPHVAHEADSLHTACALVAAGLGLCLVPAGLQDARLGSIALRPLEPSLPHAELRLAIAYRREPLCDLVQLFVNVARDVAAEQTVKI